MHFLQIIASVKRAMPRLKRDKPHLLRPVSLNVLRTLENAASYSKRRRSFRIDHAPALSDSDTNAHTNLHHEDAPIAHSVTKRRVTFANPIRSVIPDPSYTLFDDDDDEDNVHSLDTIQTFPTEEYECQDDKSSHVSAERKRLLDNNAADWFQQSPNDCQQLNHSLWSSPLDNNASLYVT